MLPLRMTSKFCLLAQFTLLSTLFGCDETAGSEAKSTNLPRPASDTKVVKTFHAELAVTPFEKSRGLMCRQHMQDDWTMLFDMGRMSRQSFWMKNTLIPLDIVFVDDQWRVVGVAANAEPQTRTPRAVDGVSRYVWELNAGQASAWNIQAGTQLEFVPPPGLSNEAFRSCRSDEECTDGWGPSSDTCGTTLRCNAGRCGEPPGMTGMTTAETGQVKVLGP